MSREVRKFCVGDLIMLPIEKLDKYQIKDKKGNLIGVDTMFKKKNWHSTKADFWLFNYAQTKTAGVLQTITSINEDGYPHTDLILKNPVSKKEEQFYFEPQEDYAHDLIIARTIDEIREMKLNQLEII
jgi:hypothetical protein